MLSFPAVFIFLRTFLAHLYNSPFFVFTAEIGYYPVLLSYYTLCTYFSIYLLIYVLFSQALHWSCLGGTTSIITTSICNILVYMGSLYFLLP